MIEQLPNLSIGVVAILGLVVLLIVVWKSVDKRDNAFRSYVDANNHKHTELVIKSTTAIEGFTANVRENTEFTKEATTVLREVRNHLIKEK